MPDPVTDGHAALAEVLAQIVPTQVEDDGALTLQHDGTVASLRTVRVAENLEIASLTQMLAWDLPLDAALREQVAQQANATMLGTVTLTELPGECADVVLRYNFPLGGLPDDALQTLVLMVLSGGAQVRRAFTD